MPAGKKSGSDKANQKAQAQQLADKTGMPKHDAWNAVQQRSGANDKPSRYNNRNGSDSNAA